MVDISLDYFSLTNYFKSLYGEVPEDYFNPDFTPNNKIKRSSEGLEIHHIKEWDEKNIFLANLSNSSIAKRNPFEYQKSENLCYVNLIDHFLLHVKIDLLRFSKFGRTFTEGSDFLFNKIKSLYDNYEDNLDNPYFLAIEDKFNYFEDVYNYWVKEKSNLVKNSRFKI